MEWGSVIEKLWGIISSLPAKYIAALGRMKKWLGWMKKWLGWMKKWLGWMKWPMQVVLVILGVLFGVKCENSLASNSHLEGVCDFLISIHSLDNEDTKECRHRLKDSLLNASRSDETNVSVEDWQKNTSIHATIRYSWMIGKHRWMIGDWWIYPKIDRIEVKTGTIKTSGLAEALTQLRSAEYIAEIGESTRIRQDQKCRDFLQEQQSVGPRFMSFAKDALCLSGKTTSYNAKRGPRRADAISTISTDILRKDAERSKRWLVDTLDLTDRFSRDTVFHLSDSSSFVGPIWGHRLQKWVVKADSGSRVAVRADAESDDFDAVLYVVHEHSMLYSDDEGPKTGSFIEFDMPSGQVDVLAGRYLDNAEGQYRLRVAGVDDHLLRKEQVSAGTLDLTKGKGVSSGTFRLSDGSSFVDPIRGHHLQRWVVRADSGGRVVVRAESDDFDAVLYVMLGDSVLYSDDEGPETSSFIEFDMPSSEQVEVDVFAGSNSPNAEEKYRLRVGYQTRFLLFDEQDSLRKSLDTLKLGEPKQYHITNGFVDPIRGHRMQRWVVEADSGSRVVVRAESDDFDAVLYMVHEDSVLYSDDEGSGTNSLLEFDMPSERVNVLAGSYSKDDARGAYWLYVHDYDYLARLLLDEAGDSFGTLGLTKEDVSTDTVSRLSNDGSSFVDPIRGHRMQRWVVEAESGNRVEVWAESDDFDAVLYVVHGDSVWYSDDEGSGTNSRLEFDMPSGRVAVLAGSYLADVEGEYQLRARFRPGDTGSSLDTLDLTGGVASEAASLSDGSSFVDPTRGHHLQKWVMEADSGSRVEVWAESDDFDAVLYVVLGDSMLYSDDDGRGTNSRLEFDMPSGRVDILAGSYLADAEGEYRLRAYDPARVLLGEPRDLLGTLELTDEVSSNTASISDGPSFVDPIREHSLQRWVVEADSDRRVVVRAESDDFDAVLYVVHEDSVLYSDDEGLGTNSRLEFDMPSSGRVTVLAGSYSANTEGEYRLRAYDPARALLGKAGDPLDTLDLTGGERVRGDTVSRLSDGSSFVDPIRGHRLQRWVVEADPGNRVVVRAEAVSDNFDAVLYVVHEDSVLYSNDEGLGTTNSRLEFNMPSGQVDVLAGSYLAAEGEYRLRVGYPARFRPGDVKPSLGTLELTDGVSSNTASISVGSSFVDPIWGHRLQRWVVEADSDRRVVVRAESDDFDAVLYVVHEDSVHGYSDDEGLGTTNSRLEFDMPSGRVDILAGSYLADAEGEYRLRAYDPARVLLGEPGDLLGTLELTDEVSSNTASISDGPSFVDPIREHRLQRWVVEADSARRVVVRAESDDFDAVLYVVHEDSVLYSDDEGLGTNSRLEFDMPSGRVTVLAGSYSANAEGEYRLRVESGSVSPRLSNDSSFVDPAHFLLGEAVDSLDTLDLTDGVGSNYLADAERSSLSGNSTTEGGHE